MKETTVTLLSDCFFLGLALPLAGKLCVVIEKTATCHWSASIR